jgi:D-arabinose 1-dehydrogenase-like Zn-dependent alcohol dehydrogenase
VAGEITELGEGVSGFAPGDRVVFMPQVTCGGCHPCRHGMYRFSFDDYLKACEAIDSSGGKYMKVMIEL